MYIFAQRGLFIMEFSIENCIIHDASGSMACTKAT